MIRNREPILTHGAKAVRAEQKRPHVEASNRTATVSRLSLLTQGIAFLRLPVKRHRVEPGHTRDTRTHTITRITQTDLKVV